MVFPWSACVCWRRDLLPAQLATAVSLQLMWKRQQSLSLDWMLLFGGHVLRHSYTLNIFSPSCPFPVYLFYFSYPSKEFFITSLWYVRLFFPFHSFSWHTFSSIHCSRSILHFSGLHSHSWPVCFLSADPALALRSRSYYMHPTCIKRKKHYLEPGVPNWVYRCSFKIYFLFVYSGVFWSGKPALPFLCFSQTPQWCELKFRAGRSS